MRNKFKNRILGRNAKNRQHLLNNLTSSLLEHGSIVTTAAKAKELRLHFEPLVTAAKKETTLALRRELMRKLAHKEDVARLLEVAEAHKERQGGYLRLTRMPLRRSDNAPEMRVDIIDA